MVDFGTLAAAEIGPVVFATLRTYKSKSLKTMTHSHLRRSVPCEQSFILRVACICLLWLHVSTDPAGVTVTTEDN